jgi:hypothetical protein
LWPAVLEHRKISCVEVGDCLVRSSTHRDVERNDINATTKRRLRLLL